MSTDVESHGISDPYLELRAVEAWVEGRKVFADLSLSLYRGEHTVILGPNGSGKSSLIRLLSREIYPVVKRGSWFRVFGEDTINLWQLRSRVGVLSQDQHTTYRGDVQVCDVVLSGFFGSVGLGRSQQSDQMQRQRVGNLLAEMGLANLASRAFQELSQGQRRRVMLARALVHAPEVLVLDEPSDGLDIGARHQVLSQLESLAQRGTTLLLVTHRIEEILPVFSRVVLLKSGRVVGNGPPDALLQDAALSALFDTPLKVLQQGGYRQVVPASAQGA